MVNPTPSEALPAVQMLRPFNQYLDDNGVAQVDSSPTTNADIRRSDGIESRVMEEIQTVYLIIKKFVTYPRNSNRGRNSYVLSI